MNYKKVTAFIGSARRDGLINRICHNILQGASSKGATVELINLYDYTINYCIGCWTCYTEEKCFQEDDFSLLYEKLKDSSAIILGSPVYLGSVTGIMKNFFDRHTGYALYNPKDAQDLCKLPTFTKLRRLVREIPRFGPMAKDQWGKRFVLVMASTLPFPYTFLTGQNRNAMKALTGFVYRMRGHTVSKIMFSDSLIRIRRDKEKKYLKKAFLVGRKL